ncbi:TetR/AcrR family transcriptional regulator [Novosphingobium tardum]|uniref:TetR/AcrR family transcriptional regulator n=1 Tax=Novosphingobium tardum TaxID=1538021 RepID=A0ABV8RSY7_9SPHN
MPRAGRPATPLITRQTASDAALKLIDRHGLDGLSLQGVARELGVSAPSLYHHFKDKEEILTEVVRRMLEEIGAEQDTWSDDWETRTIELSLATRRVMLRHPNGAPLALRFFPRKLMLPAYERSLIDCPYSPEAQAVILEAVEKFTYGTSLFAAAAEAHHVPAMPTVDAGRFPRLAHALKVAPGDDEAIHVEALKALLDGFRVRFGSKLAKD